MKTSRQIVLDTEGGTVTIHGLEGADACLRAAIAVQASLGTMPVYFAELISAAPSAPIQPAPEPAVQEPVSGKGVSTADTPAQAPSRPAPIQPARERAEAAGPSRRKRSQPVMPFVKKLIRQEPKMWLSASEIMEKCEGLGWENMAQNARGAESVRRALDRAIERGKAPIRRRVSQHDNRTRLYWLGESEPPELPMRT